MIIEILIILAFLGALLYINWKATLIGFVIYTLSFCSLGNTCYRIGSDGLKHIRILPLFTEGFIYPFRTIFLSFGLPLMNQLSILRKLLITPINPYFSLLIGFVIISIFK
jgi:hypothetical protein